MFQRLFFFAMFCAFWGQIAAAQSLSGSYLAGRYAQNTHDFRSAGSYLLNSGRQDPANIFLAIQAMSSFLAADDVEGALELARAIEKAGGTSPIGDLILAADEARSGNFDGLLDRLNNGAVAGLTIDKLILGWTHIGRGQVSLGLKCFDEVIAEDSMSDFARYQKALALASVGDFEGANTAFLKSDGTPIQTFGRAAMARAQILSQLGQNDVALNLLGGPDRVPEDQLMRDLYNRLLTGDAVAFDIVQSPSDGIAEVLYAVAEALRSDTEPEILLFYARAVTHIAPHHIQSVLLSSQLLTQLGNFDLATKEYNKVPSDSPAFLEAEMGRAAALWNAQKPDAAIEVLEQLNKTAPNVRRIPTELGGYYRNLERYEDAVAVYDKAVALTKTPTASDWFLFFTRAIAFERSGNWDAAEADFRKALELSPNQHQVLNYLGYSLVERDEKLDEALSMIERAVEAQPDAGYIIDSLGWVYFRLGRYSDAVDPMERAVELMATDPIVNDHLGDVYWAVGRKTEARFQWRRALSFVTQDTDLTQVSPDRIRAKLDVGLDQVLIDENQPPLKMAHDAN